MLTDREEIALRLFAAMISNGSRVSTGDRLGEHQIKTSFALADTFQAVGTETRSDTPSPSQANPRETLNTIIKGGG